MQIRGVPRAELALQCYERDLIMPIHIFGILSHQESRQAMKHNYRIGDNRNTQLTYTELVDRRPCCAQ